TARHLAAVGHDVAVGYRSDPAAAEDVVAAVEAAGGRGLAVRVDVREPGEIDALFTAAAELGPVTGLVANAGLTAHVGDLADTPVEVVREVVEVNLLG